MPTENLICCSLSLPAPSTLGAPNLILYMLREKNKSLWQHPVQWGGQACTHLISSFLWKKLQSTRSAVALSCSALGDGWQRQSQIIPLIYSKAFRLLCFDWTSLLKSRFPQGFLVYGWLTRLVFSRYIWTRDERVYNYSEFRTEFTDTTNVHLPITRYIDELGSLSMRLDPPIPIEAFCWQMDA